MLQLAKNDHSSSRMELSLLCLFLFQMIYSRTLFLLSICFALLPFAFLNAELSSMELFRTFDASSKEPGWTAQNDGVMGGVSSGKAEINEGELHFSGMLSLENNGGFAQIYSQTEVSDFSNYSVVKLRVKGDGRTYQFRIMTDARFSGSQIAYRAEFKTEANEWIEISIPFELFVPSFRGRLLEGPPMNLTSVQRIAFLLSDGIPGSFSLKVDWIGLEVQ